MIGPAAGQDVEAPAVVVTVDGIEGEDGWYTSPVEVTVSASDSGSGVATVEYRIEGVTDWTAYVWPFEIASDGEWVVEARAYDNEGNVGEDDSPVRIDGTAPVTSSAAEGPVVNLTAADGTSGVYATWYRVDGGDWTLYDGPFEIAGEGNHSLEYWSVDAAGNQEPVEERQVEVIRTESAFNLEWWMVVLVGLLLLMIALGKIFGMRRKAKESDARSAVKDIGTAMSQMMEDVPQKPPADKPPADIGPPKPK
ncbi:MAG: hypothetical protein AB1793_08410 [Candidatus Thermoplasmatota archaeon]